MKRPLVDHVASWALMARGFERRSVLTSHGRARVFVSAGQGELPPVVFLHGIAACAADLSSIFLRVRPHVRRVIAVDFPGHGESDAPHPAPAAVFDMLRETLDATLEQLREPAFLFGNSLGGFAAIRYANARPERVLGMLLSSPGGASAPDAETHARFIDGFREAAGPKSRAFARDLFERPPWYSPAVAAVLRQRFADPWLRATLERATHEQMLTPAEIGAIACPVLVVWGGRDRTQPRAQLDFFKAHLPAQAVVEEPAEYTHCPHLERADEMAERLVDFMREVTGAQAGPPRTKPAARPSPSPRRGAAWAADSDLRG